MSVPNDLSRANLPPFANQLIQSGYITLPQLQQALIEKRKTNRPLIEILPIVTGRPLPPDLLHRGGQLARLRATYGVECLDPETETIDWSSIEHLFKTVLPFEICRRYQILPLRRQESTPNVLFLAMVDPANQEILDDLRRILRDRELRFDRRAIILADYQALIETYRARKEDTVPPEYSPPENPLQTLVDVTDIIEDDRPERILRLEESAENIGALSPAHQGPIVTLVTNLLVRAIESKASEIYLEPEENQLTIRFRQDGLLQTGFEPVSREASAAVLTRVKILANLETGQAGQPGRGKITRTFSGRRIDFHVHTVPSRYGEKIVLRVFDSRSALWSLDELMPIEDTRERVRSLLDRPSGAILLTSPAAGGRSTTFYSLLANRHQAGLSIATVENPIERVLNGVAQVEIDPGEGNEPSSIARSLFSRGVNAIGIDGLDDRSIADGSIESAAAGHLVLSCLPADSATEAITRLGELADSRAVADTLIGVINQRLLRRVCPVCRLKHVPSADELAKFGLSSRPGKPTHFYKANSLNEEEIDRARERGRLCRHCNGIGYQGQIGVFEVMSVSPRLQTSIADNADATERERIVLQEGFKPLLDYALELVARGDTTLEEVDRVLGDRLPVANPISPTPPDISKTAMKRIEELERLIKAIDAELQALKREISEIPPPVASPPAASPTIVYERLKEPASGQTERPDWEPDKETLVAETSIYEELTDPGDWEQLKQEIDPAKDTIISENDLSDDPSTWNVDSSFRSVPDPW